MKSDIHSIKRKALQWANQFEVCCFLDSNQYTDLHSQTECLLAAGTERELNLPFGNAFEQLKQFYRSNKQWMFGLLSYELKNELEALKTTHSDALAFPDLYFFIPKYLIAIKGDKIEVLLGDKVILEEIENIEIEPESTPSKVKISQKFDKKSYIDTVELLKNHIKRGDIYEINFCQEFFAENAIIDPLNTYLALNAVSPTPFSGYFKIYDKYILSATPERFLCKRGSKLISQPIKGTAKRSHHIQEDEQIKAQLKSSIKEQAENVMIVDLVRNDLTKSAVKGSVKVDELFGIYSFPQVHQMISTVSCELASDVDLVEAIKNTFPMGSMTGAPKFRALQLIDEYEKSKRGAFSGSFGYINPDGDFDFNVIIRSILYNASSKHLSYQVGGAITYASSAIKEYEECLLKASAIIKVIGQ